MEASSHMATPVQTHSVLCSAVVCPLCSPNQALLASNNPPPPPPPLRGSMKRLLRRLSRVAAADACAAAAGAYQPLREASKSAAAAASVSVSVARLLGGGARVPEGHVPVCVGEEGGPVERYAVRAELLGRPAFAALLRRAAQEYGYGHPGALRIPCPVADFRDLLLHLSSSAAADDEAAAGYYY